MSDMSSTVHNVTRWIQARSDVSQCLVITRGSV